MSKRKERTGEDRREEERRGEEGEEERETYSRLMQASSKAKRQSQHTFQLESRRIHISRGAVQMTCVCGYYVQRLATRVLNLFCLPLPNSSKVPDSQKCTVVAILKTLSLLSFSFFHLF